MGRGFGIASSIRPDVVREVAREAERLGYTSFWVNDTPAADGLASLDAAADATDHIDLGVGVIPLDRRPPDVLAEEVRHLRLPLDRFLLGVGGGSAPGALARVRSGVDALERSLATRVVVGALGPKMSVLAGETADGVLLNWLTPEYAGLTAREVVTAAERARRPRPKVLAYVRCALLSGAARRLHDELALYAGIPSFEQHVKRMDVDPGDTYIVGTGGAALQEGLAHYEAVLDETVVRAITPDDSLDSILTLLHACAP
jgi:alkanesulfonate monooxygenase SsuD/methylene tetrahydromethanopterin reductase-like flavin-dependent oxidoreductase (luciferase family)